MATCKIGKLKFSLHMTEFRSEVGFPTFYCLFVLFFANKAAPTNVKANRRKPRTLVYRVSVKINLQKKLGVVKKIKYSLPWFVYFMAKANGPQFFKAVITVPITPAHILFSAQTLNEYLYVDVCNNLLKHI